MALHLLLIGAGGLLGGHLLRATARMSAWETIPVFHSYVPDEYNGTAQTVDITDISAIDSLLNAFQPDVVVNATCMPVGDCEEYPEKAKALQVTGPANVARVCGRSIRLIHMSTDMVYSGLKGAPYTPADAPDPVSVYGATKLAGEREVEKRNGNFVILRNALILAKPVFRPGGFIDWMATHFLKDSPVTLFTDQLRTPVPASDLVNTILALAGSDFRGILPAGGGQGVNRVQMGEWLAQAMGKTSSLIKPAPMAEFKSEVPLQKDLRLDSAATEQIAGVHGTDIKGYIQKLGREYVSA